MKKNNRGKRAYSLICYFTSNEEVFTALNTINDLQKFAFIYHDRDTTTPHYHIVIITANTHSMTSIQKRFINETTATNCLIEPLLTPQGIYDYMTHSHNVDKYQYSYDDIVSNDKDYFATAEKINDICVDIVTAMLHNVSKYELVKLYGKHFVYNYRNFLYLVNDIKDEQ